jgi:hypothetical protein
MGFIGMMGGREKRQKKEKYKYKKNLWETEWKMPLEPRLKILENICQCCTA